MPTPRNLGAIFPQDFLNAAFRIGTLEARDVTGKRGANPGTVASILNRYYTPGYGSNWRSWLLNPNQYAVLKKPSKETGSQARQYYSTPEGIDALRTAGAQLGGVPDFRSTSYLKGQGLLMKYPDNLIPVNVGGSVQYLPTGELQKRKLSPYLNENTFFSETGKKSQKKWWELLGPRSEAEATEAQPTVASAPVKEEDFDLAGQNPLLMSMAQKVFAPILSPQDNNKTLGGFMDLLASMRQ